MNTIITTTSIMVTIITATSMTILYTIINATDNSTNTKTKINVSNTI